jgi:membrane protease YdiL (CAAX protease family)
VCLDVDRKTKARVETRRCGERLGSIAALLGVALAFSIPILPAARYVYLLTRKVGGTYIITWGITQLGLELSVVVLMPLLFALLQRQDVRLLLRAKEGRFFADVASGIGAFVLVMVAGAVRRSPDLGQPPLQKTPGSGYIVASPAATPFALSLPLRIAMSLTNGISEELGCRAYAILSLESVSIPPVLAAVICWIGSVVIHLPAYGLNRQVVITQLIFILLYEYRRSLIASGLAHILSDVFALVVLA